MIYYSVEYSLTNDAGVETLSRTDCWSVADRNRALTKGFKLGANVVTIRQLEVEEADRFESISQENGEGD